MIHLDLFSGIGGFALAADWIWPGITHVFCEIEPFPQKVLRKHWPKAEIFTDIKELDGKAVVKKYGAVEFVTGGFPCQPFSVAGKRGGQADDRYLWPEMFRVIKEARPGWVIAENVPGIIDLALDQVYDDLESIGYETGTVVIPACGVAAWHIRKRVWILANAIESDCGQGNGKIATGRYPDSAGKNQGPYFFSHTKRTKGNRGEYGDVVEKECGEESSHAAAEFSGADVSYADGKGLQKSTFAKFAGVYEQNEESAWGEPGRIAAEAREYWSVEPSVGRVANGVPHRVDRLRSLGNAIVPQVAAVLMCFIREIEDNE